MPSFLFSRNDVLASLSDEAARQEQEAIPDFIYFFLRDVFYAIDGDGDGYVTAAAVLSALPCLSSYPAKHSPATSPISRTPPQSSSSFSSAGVEETEGRAGLMTPGVRHLWYMPPLYTIPSDAAMAHRPLDLYAFMQTFWPLVSDRMARLVGDTWSQQSSGSDSGAAHDGASVVDMPASSRGRSRPSAFSPSPFRSVSVSPPSCAAAAAADTSRAVARRHGESPQTSVSSTSPTQHFAVCEGVAWDQQRLYREALQQLWPPMVLMGGAAAAGSAAVHDTPLESTHQPFFCSASRPAPFLPPPQRLLSDDEVEELRVAFDYLDCTRSGYASTAEVAAALQSLLSRAGQQCADSTARGDTSTESCGLEDTCSDVRELARSMVLLALSFSPTTSAAAIPTTTVTHASLGSLCVPTRVASSAGGCLDMVGEPCLTWTAFVRSFQCDSGAFPAELVAWCVSCRNASSAAQTASAAPPPHALATSTRWMSPLECAAVQQILMCYATQLSGLSESSGSISDEEEGVDQRAMQQEDKASAQGGSSSSTSRASVGRLSQRASVNMRPALKPSRGRTSVPASERRAPSDTTTVLPLAVLGASLLKDVRATLFETAADFSASASADAEAVARSHVRAVCDLARRVAATQTCRGPFHRPHSTDAPADGATLIDVAQLAAVLAGDPQCLSLDVALPLSTRLEAVVWAAQRLPRKVAELAVEALREHLEKSVADNNHDSHRSGSNTLNLSALLALRRHVMTLSPPLARVLTGATRFASGQLQLHDCLVVLATQVLAVPPLCPPCLLSRQRCSPPSNRCNSNKKSASVCAAMCAEMLRDSLIVKASRGWLRYACRRLPAQERRCLVSALQTYKNGGIFFSVVRPFMRACVTLSAQQPSLHDVYASLFSLVCKASWTCLVDPVVAAHVTLVILATASAMPNVTPDGEGCEKMDDLSQWAEAVEAGLAEWVRVQWKAGVKDEAGFVDAWAMAAITSCLSEIGLAGCRSISAKLAAQLHSEPPSTSHSIEVKEEDVLKLLEDVVLRESVWASTASHSPRAVEACQRLSYVLAGCCPTVRDEDQWAGDRVSGAGAADAVQKNVQRVTVDLAIFLRRWLERCPLPLPVQHVSLACEAAEVESIYYTLKRLAASEASQRRRSESPRSRATSEAQLTASGRSTARSVAGANGQRAVVVTGITPVCLGELLENDAVLLALYSVSPQRAVGVWSGSLCYLESVLRPVVLSATGVRVSLRKLHDATSATHKAVHEEEEGHAESSNHLTTGDAAAAAASTASDVHTSLLIAMALPAALQHAVAQLFHRVDSAESGLVTEDQLRCHRTHVPSAARYGWHRFVTMLCSASVTSPATAVVSGGFSASVVRSHCWRRGRTATVTTGSGSPDAASEASVATQRSDDVATVYTMGDLLTRAGELRACVQAQLLQEKMERGRFISSPVKPSSHSSGVFARDSRPPSSADVTAAAAAAAASTAGSAQWWATYIEVFCRCYSPLA